MLHSQVTAWSDPSWLEIAVLAILLARLRRRFSGADSASRWMPSAARATDPDFHLRPLGPRIRDFVWEVMLQGKVIRQRPLPGLAHAFVFWGFCAFALITLNHLAAGFGFPFLSRDERLRQSLFRVRGRVRGAGGGFDRRPGLPPLRGAAEWLGEVSPESGVIALLIFILMVTYLAGLLIGRSDHRGAR